MPSFNAPSFRAAQSDLAISVSPLGLIELSDEEFEIHGPRLNRYATNWAFYLGHHWGYTRAAGEPLLTFNYSRAFSDFITNFTFGRGVDFITPKMTEAIVPTLLERVWNVDNDKKKVLWRMGQVGSVTGDAFVKVAYEDPFVDPAGRVHPGRLRIIPLNSNFCFPEWHPHDRDRMIRFKLKYRFWGTAPDGTRQVFTYTEISTDDVIEEYINDEMIDQRMNPLGAIPVVHTANFPVEGSPWGLSDIQDIIGLNREFNEKATEISDIINYHAEPVTVITGAKASNLEKASNRLWAGLPKEANVFNLEMGTNLQGPMAYLDMLKRGMHEMTGVPETALGQRQPISNTSGVALHIEYQPLMNRYSTKTMMYGEGLTRINELVLLTLAVKEPQSLIYNPSESTDFDVANEAYALDPADPLTYRTEVDFPPPLPVDEALKLAELQQKMSLGLESKRGSLRALGESFPDEKLAEVQDELHEDMLAQGALSLLNAEISATIMALTGLGPDGVPPDQTEGTGEGGVQTAGGVPENPIMSSMNAAANPDDLMTKLVTKAHSVKQPPRANPQAQGDS